MKKWGIVVGIILLILVVIFFVINLSIDTIVEHGIEKYAPRATGTKVTVSAVNLSLFSGQGSIYGLTIYNPKGFQSKYAIHVKKIFIDLDLDSLFSDTILVNQVDVIKPHIIYETGLGGSNIGAITSYSRQRARSEPPKKVASTTTAKQSSGKSVVVKSLNISEGQVTGKLGFVGVTLALPPIQLKNLGQPGSGVSVAQVTNIILGAILRSLTSLNLNTLTQSVGAVGKAVGQTVVDVGNTAANVGGQAAQGVGDVVQGVGKGVGSVFQGIFGGGKKASQDH